MKVDPLCFLLMIEAILLMGSGLAYFAYRDSRRKKHAEGSAPSEPGALLRMLEEGIEEAEESQKTHPEGKEPFAVLLAGKVAEAHIALMRKMVEGMRTEEVGPLDSISRWILDGFEDTVIQRLQGIEGYFQARFQEQGEEAPAEALSDAENMRQEGQPRKVPEVPPVDGAEALKTVPNVRDPAFVRERVDTDATFAKMRDHFSAVVVYNTELKERLTGLREHKAPPGEIEEALSRNIEQIEGVIQELEQSNRELDLCVRTLENANEDLSNQLAELTKRLGGVENEESDPAAAPVGKPGANEESDEHPEQGNRTQ